MHNPLLNLVLLAFQQITPTPFAPVAGEPTVTITFQPSQLLTWLIVGLIAGALASAIIRGRISLIGSLVVGLLGAFIGGFLLTYFRLDTTPALQGGIVIRWIDIIGAFVGALIVLFLVSSIFRWRR